MRRGVQLALAAMRKEHKLLSRRAEKAKAAADENINVADELVAIHQELHEIIASRETGEDVLRRLNDLKKRRARADRILKKDSSNLFDKQIQAEIDRDSLLNEIQLMEFRHRRPGGTHA